MLTAEDHCGIFVQVFVSVCPGSSFLMCCFSSSLSCCLKKRLSSVQICAWGSWDTVAAASAQYGHTRVPRFTFWWDKTLRLAMWVSCCPLLDYYMQTGRGCWVEHCVFMRKIGCWKAYHLDKHESELEILGFWFYSDVANLSLDLGLTNPRVLQSVKRILSLNSSLNSSSCCLASTHVAVYHKGAHFDYSVWAAELEGLTALRPRNR